MKNKASIVLLLLITIITLFTYYYYSNIQCKKQIKKLISYIKLVSSFSTKKEWVRLQRVKYNILVEGREKVHCPTGFKFQIEQNEALNEFKIICPMHGAYSEIEYLFKE
ncbi:hypothetical protein ACFL35_18475 [Candidatus Riflebacteria bacterium]